LQLEAAEGGGSNPHGPAQQPSVVGVDVLGSKRNLHSRDAELHSLRVDQRRQFYKPGPTARPRHLATPDAEHKMRAAISPASDRRLPTDAATLQDVPAGADDNARRPSCCG